MQELTVVDTSAGANETTPPVNPYFVADPRQKPEPGVTEDKTKIAGGDVLLRWHDSICSAEDVEELEYWLNGILRRARRQAGLPVDHKG